MKALPLAAALLVLAGCTRPYEWKGTWNATQDNKANLAAQVADWRDLAHGHGDPGADGQEATRAVERLRRDKVKRLPDIETSDVSGGASSAPSN